MFSIKIRYLILFLLLCPFSSTLKAQKATKPNILFILADDRAWQDLGC